MDNVTYIENWFLEKNQFLKDRNDKYQMLHILVFWVLVFESFEKINEDKIYKIGNSYEVKSGKKVENALSENILKMVNIEFANLEYDDLLNTNTYKNFFYKLGVEDGLLNNDWLSVFESTYNFLKNHYENYNYDKFVYKIKRKVFYSINPLSDDEIERLSQIPESDEQMLWEVFHEDGKMFWW